MMLYLANGHLIAYVRHILPLLQNATQNNVVMYVKAMWHTLHNLLSTPDHSLQLRCVQKYFFVVPGSAKHISQCAHNLNTVVIVMFGAVVLETTPRKTKRSNNSSPSQITQTNLCEGCPSIVHLSCEIIIQMSGAKLSDCG